jgi:hypothetical protein
MSTPSIGSAIGGLFFCGLLAAAPASAIVGGGSITPGPFGKWNRLLPTTGALLVADGDGDGGVEVALECSATLIGCSTVLTAAHCVKRERPGEVWVFFPHGGTHAVERIAVHPDYEDEDADLAVLTLATPVTGITPSRLNDIADPADLPGSRGVIAGFGITAELAWDSGILRNGVVSTGSCSELSEGKLSDRSYVCWRYDGLFGESGHDANTCTGDSGGPLFLTIDGHTVVAGVTAGGSSATCGDDEVSYTANVFTWLPFIERHLGDDSTAACGGLPAVGSPSTSVVDRALRLDAGEEVRYQLTVPPGARELRLALNAQDAEELAPGLRVVGANGERGDESRCRVDAAGRYTTCRFADPVPGSWTVAVRVAGATGDVQLTGTLFGGSLVADGGTVGQVDAEAESLQADADEAGGDDEPVLSVEVVDGIAADKGAVAGEPAPEGLCNGKLDDCGGEPE